MAERGLFNTLTGLPLGSNGNTRVPPRRAGSPTASTHPWRPIRAPLDMSSSTKKRGLLYRMDDTIAKTWRCKIISLYTLECHPLPCSVLQNLSWTGGICEFNKCFILVNLLYTRIFLVKRINRIFSITFHIVIGCVWVSCLRVSGGCFTVDRRGTLHLAPGHVEWHRLHHITSLSSVCVHHHNVIQTLRDHVNLHFKIGRKWL